MPTVNSFPVNPGWKLLLTNADINTTKVPRRAYLLPVLLSVFLMAGAAAAAGPDTTSLAERTQDRRLAISAGVFLVCARHGHRLGGVSPLPSRPQRGK